MGSECFVMRTVFFQYKVTDVIATKAGHPLFQQGLIGGNVMEKTTR